MEISLSKILVVDDNTFYLKLLKTILKDVEAEVFMAGSGKEALELVKKNDFALAILDIQMPEMDGFELAGHIRTMDNRDLVPIIFLTAYATDEIQLFKGYDHGAIDYLTKPVNKLIFVSKVKIFLELDQQKRSLIQSKQSLQESKLDLENKQNELKESEELYHSLLKTSPDGIVLIDMDGKITEASDIALALLGNKQFEIEGMDFRDFIPEESLKEYLIIYKKTLQGGLVQNLEMKMNRIDKTKFTGEISVSQIKGNNHELKAFMVVIRDISERKLFENQLRHSERMAGIGELATGMAHEINQPLNTISMAIDNILFSLENRNLTDTYLKAKINKVFDSINRVKKIIDHVRTFSRDQDDFVQQEFDINKSIKSSISMVEEQFINKTIELIFKPEDSIPTIIGNAYRFEQVILNMLINAKDAIEGKKKIDIKNAKKLIEVSTRKIDEQIIIEIRDNGTGINSENLEKVILPFFTTKDPGKGTGLGLSISYGIIKELGGDLEIKSTPKIGTSIFIKIPVQKINNYANSI